MTVVSNTSPLRYLIAVGRTDLVEHIFGRVLIPLAVQRELTHESAPRAVRQWMAQRPRWLAIRDSPRPPDAELAKRLDCGEAEAIQLAADLGADFLLMDERSGRRIATARGLTVIGALGILLVSYGQGLLQNPLEVLAQLRATGFRISRRLAQGFEERIRVMKPKTEPGSRLR